MVPSVIPGDGFLTSAKGTDVVPGAHFLVLTFVSADREDIWGRLPRTVDQAIQFATLVIGVVLLTWLGRLP